MTAVALLQLRQILSGKKVWILALLLAFPLLLTGVVVRGGAWTGKVEELAKGIYLFVLYPQVACLLLALLYGTTILSTEIEWKTLTYLFTRPLARWRILTGKYLAVVACLLVPSTASLLGSWLILGTPGGGRFFLAMWLAVLGAIAVYSAIFAAIGVLFRARAMVIGIMYALIFEGSLSFVPAVVNAMTVSYYLRSVVLRVTDLEVPAKLARLVGGASVLESAAVLAGIAASALAAASVVATVREHSLAEQV